MEPDRGATERWPRLATIGIVLVAISDLVLAVGAIASIPDHVMLADAGMLAVGIIVVALGGGLRTA